MRQEDLNAAFDQQASSYDDQWDKIAPILNGLYFLLRLGFAEVSADARVLSVGAGTGREISVLAEWFPGWTFSVVEPSGGMLEVCRRRAEAEGFASRCTFHEGYVDSLPGDDRHQVATCFLVSQFILEPSARSAFFRSIVNRLAPGAILASGDLASDVASDAYDALLRIWIRVMTGGEFSSERFAKTREVYAKDVAVLPPAEVAAIMEAGGFATPVPFFQAGLLHAWFARRT